MRKTTTRPAWTLAVALVAGVAASPNCSRAAGTVAAGQTLFQAKCSICHSPNKGENKVGPSLYGVVGRKAGSSDYAYSDAMKNANRVWSAQTLDVYLTNPRADIPGIKMIFAGLPEQADRDNVIAYLSSLK
jgi:cytochrome c